MLEAVDQRLRQVLGAAVSEDEARALAEWYATVSGAVAAFPADELRAVEPPLRSTAGPRLEELRHAAQGDERLLNGPRSSAEAVESPRS